MDNVLALFQNINVRQNYAKLSSIHLHSVKLYPWFHGRISRGIAESILTPSNGSNVGKFLVRLSETDKRCLTLVYPAVDNDTFRHVKIYNYGTDGKIHTATFRHLSPLLCVCVCVCV